MQHLYMRLRKPCLKNNKIYMRTLSLALLIFLSCASQPIAPRPDWVLTSTSTPDNWIGIGIIEKPFSGNIREAARSQAVNEIASQISIQISSNFTNVITEYNYDVNEFSKSIVDSRVENNLEDIEYLNFHEDQYNFYVHARLSKQKYYQALSQKRGNAIETAMGYLRRSDSELNGESFKLLQSAMDEIVQFMDEPLQVEYKGKSRNLYSLIKMKFQDKVNQIQLITEEDQINITFGFSNNRTIKISSKDKNSNRLVPGIPVKIKSSENISLVSGITDFDGHVILPLPKFEYFETQKQITLSMDSQEMILSPNSYPQTPISIKINSPAMFVSIEEKLLDNLNTNPVIAPLIKEFFSTRLSANFVDIQTADLIIQGIVNTTKTSDVPNEWGIYQTFADATITVLNGRTGNEVYSLTVTQIQGADFNSNEGSAKEGIRKISKKIETISLPQILKRIQEL